MYSLPAQLPSPSVKDEAGEVTLITGRGLEMSSRWNSQWAGSVYMGIVGRIINGRRLIAAGKAAGVNTASLEERVKTLQDHLNTEIGTKDKWKTIGILTQKNKRVIRKFL